MECAWKTGRVITKDVVHNSSRNCLVLYSIYSSPQKMCTPWCIWLEWIPGEGYN